MFGKIAPVKPEGSPFARVPPVNRKLPKVTAGAPRVRRPTIGGKVRRAPIKGLGGLGGLIHAGPSQGSFQGGNFGRQ